MQQFRFFHPLWMALYSKPLYRDVARRWSGWGVGYLIFLLALAWIPACVQMHNGLARFAGDFAPKLLENMPAIQIRNGEVTVDPPGRHVLKDPESGRDFFIVDVEATPESVEELDGEVFVLTRNKLIIKQTRRGQTRIHDLSGVQEFSVNREEATRWLQTGARFFTPVVFPFLLAGSFAYRFVQILFYALMGMLMANGMKVQLSFDALMRLAAVSITAPVLVDVAYDFFKFRVTVWGLWGFLCFLLAMAYLSFGIQACKTETAAPAMTGPPGIAPGGSYSSTA